MDFIELIAGLVILIASISILYKKKRNPEQIQERTLWIGLFGVILGIYWIIIAFY